jgi:hypothetical protein
VSYFAVFLCGFAPLREIAGAREQLSRKDAKSQRRAKSNIRHHLFVNPERKEEICNATFDPRAALVCDGKKKMRAKQMPRPHCF